MKIHFAPLEVPVHRRLQTAAVVQWVFSFLGLGEYASTLSWSPGSWWLWWDGGEGVSLHQDKLIVLEQVVRNLSQSSLVSRNC